MIGNLEFELEVARNTASMIQYNILRKGLCVGILVLEEPYDKKEAEKILMTMHNTILETKEKIISDYKRNKQDIKFKDAKEVLENAQ